MVRSGVASSLTHICCYAESSRARRGGGFCRLHAECRPMQINVTQRAWALNVTVRGRPATTDLDGVLGLFDMAHVEIVTCFTAITTDAMHQVWGRQQ